MLPTGWSWKDREGTPQKLMGPVEPESVVGLGTIYSKSLGPTDYRYIINPGENLLKIWYAISLVGNNVKIYAWAGNWVDTNGSYTLSVTPTQLALAFDTKGRPVIFYITEAKKLRVRDGDGVDKELTSATSVAAASDHPHVPWEGNNDVLCYYVYEDTCKYLSQKEDWTVSRLAGVKKKGLKVLSCGFTERHRFQVTYSHAEDGSEVPVIEAYTPGIWKWQDYREGGYYSDYQASLPEDAVVWDNGDAQLSICCGVTTPGWEKGTDQRTGSLWEASLSATEIDATDQNCSVAWIGFGVGLYGRRMVDGVGNAINDLYHINFEITCGGATRKFQVVHFYNYDFGNYSSFRLMEIFDDPSTPPVEQYPPFERWRDIFEFTDAQLHSWYNSIEMLVFNITSYELETLFPGKFTSLFGYNSIGEAELKVTLSAKNGEYADLVGYMKFRVNQIP